MCVAVVIHSCGDILSLSSCGGMLSLHAAVVMNSQVVYVHPSISEERV